MYSQSSITGAELCNAGMAVENAMKHRELTSWKKLNYIGTLGATYTKVGDCDYAVKLQESYMSITRRHIWRVMGRLQIAL